MRSPAGMKRVSATPPTTRHFANRGISRGRRMQHDPDRVDRSSWQDMVIPRVEGWEERARVKKKTEWRREMTAKEEWENGGAMRYANKTCVCHKNGKSIDPRVMMREESSQIHFRLPRESSESSQETRTLWRHAFLINNFTRQSNHHGKTRCQHFLFCTVGSRSV